MVDIRCFSSSRPELRGKPVAVAHARGVKKASQSTLAARKAEMNLYRQRRAIKKGEAVAREEPSLEDEEEGKKEEEKITAEDEVEFSSMSELASVSYEARARGVRNGTFLGSALKLCPELVTVPYDFAGYQEVARTLYDTVAAVTLEVQAVSCDEMIADVTEVLDAFKVC